MRPTFPVLTENMPTGENQSSPLTGVNDRPGTNTGALGVMDAKPNGGGDELCVGKLTAQVRVGNRRLGTRRFGLTARTSFHGERGIGLLDRQWNRFRLRTRVRNVVER